MTTVGRQDFKGRATVDRRILADGAGMLACRYAVNVFEGLRIAEHTQGRSFRIGRSDPAIFLFSMRIGGSAISSFPLSRCPLRPQREAKKSFAKRLDLLPKNSMQGYA
ncbi:MAG: hypothetical protein CVV45_18040 [Spirochaetae bacterium HGW-Spirochaetae-10]|nr:MAG: hypothetical protein CVV45_18040 [Spirochaetae bacterium HGW-Spirochaetae-10]